MAEYSYKIADTESEFEQIHRLNYQTFVEEIPQHKQNPEGSLVDKFHDQNTYIICKLKDQVAGMIAIRDQRPFSLDLKLSDLESYLPDEYASLCEIRLLSISKQHRSRTVIRGLFADLARFCESRKYEIALISANPDQKRLYENLGFVPFGPLVGSEDAMYQPMYLTLDSYSDFKHRSRILRMNNKKVHSEKDQGHSIFLPGPVEINPAVKKEFEKPPVSHRSRQFVSDFRNTVNNLAALAGSAHAEIIMGSGTLANDVIAGQLSLLGQRGLVLSNGEFGNRLIDHAKRFGLDFDCINTDWGDCFLHDDTEEKLKSGEYGWLWMVHCETSTGVINDTEYFLDLSTRYSVKLCVDCISSIGNVPLDLGSVYLASGVSGKGLGSYPGLCFVFYNHEIRGSSGTLPRYLDLGCFRSANGVPYTLSSNHLYALAKSLEIIDVRSRYGYIKDLSVQIRKELQECGVEVLGSPGKCSPAVITFRLPESMDSESLGSILEEKGFYISYRSEYLLERNLMQIALMGEFSEKRLNELVNCLSDILKQDHLATLSF